ncbi:MAG: hypothetical protein J6D46_04785 [Lachnospiraceae bacterium]|nr:hypothetical protein [Lachnospiraceae bacterium]
MPKREKCTYEEKIKAVEDYLNGVRSQKQIAVDPGFSAHENALSPGPVRS